MQKTKIEWVKNPDGTQGFTSNPIKGLCPVQCRLPDGKIYCYGRLLYKRYKWDDRFIFWIDELLEIEDRKKPAGIFLCSTFELFHKITLNIYSKEWHMTYRDRIFQTFENCPQHRFYVLTKFPQNIDRPMPDNVWLGCTITKQDEMKRMGYLKEAQAKIKFISFEPLLSSINLKAVYDNAYEGIDWIIIGALTGKESKKYAPKKEWIQEFIELVPLHIKIFLKDNLKEIWGENLIQEMPE